MVTVRTKEEFQRAIQNNENELIVVGSLADELMSKKRKENAAKTSGFLLLIGSLVALPFTGGASAAGIIAGAAALTAGTVILSAAELAIILGGAYALSKRIDSIEVERNPDGSVRVKIKNK